VRSQIRFFIADVSDSKREKRRDCKKGLRKEPKGYRKLNIFLPLQENTFVIFKSSTGVINQQWDEKTIY